MANFAPSQLKQQCCAHHLDAARGGARAAAHNHHQQQHHFDRHGPEVKIRRGIAGGGHHAGHLEAAVAQRLPEAMIARQQQHGGKNRRRSIDAQIPVQLLAAQRIAPVPRDGTVKQREIDAEQHHEKRDDPLDQWAVEGRDAGAVIAEAARARRAEGMDRRVVGIHPRQQQHRKLQRRQGGVDQIQNLG